MTLEPFCYRLTVTEKLNFKEIPAWVNQAVLFLLENQKKAYLVGGAIRDLIWGNTPSDWDLATDALPDEIERIFPKTIPTGKKFGTITVLIDDQQVEITTLREELGYSDSRRPDKVIFGADILKDLARRDFTINAMAYDFFSQVLVDPFGGKKDCYDRILKAVGDPQVRFQEDGLRMFRLYRFLASHELTSERETEGAVNPEWARRVSYERIRDEFSKLLLGVNVRKGLNGLAKSGLLSLIIPEFFTNGQTRSETHSQLWEHSLSAVEAIQPLLRLRLAALLHDIAKPVSLTITKTGTHFYGHEQIGAEMSKSILERLKYPRKLIETVTLLIHQHMFSYQSDMSDSAIRRLISKVEPENIPDLLELRRADIVATGKVTAATPKYWGELSERILAIVKSAEEGDTQNKMALNGHELIEHFDIKPGPLVGTVIAYLSEQIIVDPELNRKDRLLELAQNYLKSKKLSD